MLILCFYVIDDMFAFIVGNRKRTVTLSPATKKRKFRMMPESGGGCLLYLTHIFTQQYGNRNIGKDMYMIQMGVYSNHVNTKFFAYRVDVGKEFGLIFLRNSFFTA